MSITVRVIGLSMRTCELAGTAAHNATSANVDFIMVIFPFREALSDLTGEPPATQA
jgi:hypothetical protein